MNCSFEGAECLAAEGALLAGRLRGAPAFQRGNDLADDVVQARAEAA